MAKTKTAPTETKRRLVCEIEAAAILGTTPGTLRQERHTPTWGLSWVKLGRAVRYDLAALEAFIASRTITPDPDLPAGR